MELREPVLTTEDRRRWRQLERTVEQWTCSAGYQRRVAIAKERIRKTVATAEHKMEIAWSGGKDSTAMTALVADVCNDGGLPIVPAMSIKDDLDFPGEEEYINDIAAKLGIPLIVIKPSYSLLGWIKDHADELMPGEDIHGRAAALSRKGFYQIVSDHQKEAGIKTVFLGLRSEESKARGANRASHGWQYTKRDGLTVSQPICDWRGLDVYTYLYQKGVEPLPLYRCIRYHKEPWRVRKSWWLPGAAAQNGQGVWLRSYYPSLFWKLCEMLPHHRCLT